MDILNLKGVQMMRLKDLREDNDLTQKEVADYLHIRQNTYSQYETMSRQLSMECLVRLAAYYGTSTDYILELTDEKKPYPPSKRRKWT